MSLISLSPSHCPKTRVSVRNSRGSDWPQKAYAPPQQNFWLNYGPTPTPAGVSAFDIYPESETNFFLKFDGAQLTFIKNDKGEVTAVIHHMDGRPDLEGKKLKK
jgi:hypothetical protein